MARVVDRADIWVDGLAAAAQAVAVAIDYGAELQDGTTMANDGHRANVPGLTTVGLALEGFTDPAADAQLFGMLGGDVDAFTVDEAPAVAGGVVFLLAGPAGEYTPLDGTMGELVKFRLGVSGTRLARGRMIAAGTFNNGLQRQSAAWAALGAGKKRTCHLHVVALDPGATPRVVVSSKSADSAGGGTNRITFNPTAPGALVQSVSGAITDRYWRVEVSGLSGAQRIGLACALEL